MAQTGRPSARLRTTIRTLGPTTDPTSQDEMASRLRRFPALTSDQIAELVLTLDPDVVDAVSDAVLAEMVLGLLPGLPLNPNGGLPLGLPGAVMGARFVGGTTSGPPTSGTFQVRDFVLDASGAIFACTVAGTPGTWVQSAGPSYALNAFTSIKTSAYTAVAGDIVRCNTTSGTFAITLPHITANSYVRVKWRAGTVAPTVVAGASATLDSTWPGFGVVGDSADFAYDGSLWNYL